MKKNSEITKETRREAYKERPLTRKADIKALLVKRDMTARELAYALGYTERNAVAPRLTEMMNSGEVEVIGKTKDATTGKSVALYRIK